MALNNVFIGGGDPLLGSSSNSINADMEAYERRLQEILSQVQAQKQMALNPQSQAQRSQSPLWDEIDNIVNDMTDMEIDVLNNDPAYQKAQNTLMGILNREYMRIMRPIVEGVKDGKETLENLMSITKRVKKSASEEANKNIALFNEYTSKYADMPYAEFLKLKNSGNKKKSN
jgi:hypothetical protein|nr:MAG TPA_asm: hypothetical protein [Caudoviricetes sp.]